MSDSAATHLGLHGSSEYDLLDRLAEEFIERYRRGERPALRGYTERHPDLAEEIRELFPALVQIEQVEGDLRDPGGRKGASSVPEPVPPPRQIGDFEIIGEVGRGGMGIVYEAQQVSLGRRVALKVLRGTSGDASTLERFRREARAAARLHHTNIVPVYEVGHEGEIFYYAMQFIEGQGLDLVIGELRRIREVARRDGRRATGGDHRLGCHRPDAGEARPGEPRAGEPGRPLAPDRAVRPRRMERRDGGGAGSVADADRYACRHPRCSRASRRPR